MKLHYIQQDLREGPLYTWSITGWPTTYRKGHVMARYLDEESREDTLLTGRTT